MKKKKVLFLTEATYLSTGYATYSKEILDRLYDSGKYEIAEFSIYGPADSPERKKIRWKNYPNMPDRNNKRETDIYSSSPENQFGAWRFEQICFDFKPDVVCSIRDYWMDSFVYKSPYRRLFKWCFPAGTPVLNKFGYTTNIEDIKIGDSVISHKGNSCKVTNLDNHYYSGRMIKIKAEGMCEPVICTEDHEILTIKNSKRVWNNNLKKYNNKIESVDVNNKEFIAASDLNIGDYLLIPIQNRGNGINFSNDDLWIIGHFLADGCAKDQGRISFAFNKNEVNTLQKVVDYFNNPAIIEKFKIKTPQGEHCKSSENGHTWRLNNVKLQKFFSQFYQHNKKVLPIEFEKMTKDQAKYLISGYFSGDGCKTITNHNNPSVEMFSSSKILARQISQLCWSIGYPVRLKNRKNQDGYSIRLSGKYCNDFKKELYIESENSKKDFTRVIIKDNYVLMPIHSIESYEDDLQVYDIEVENDHSFITHCAVHNCWMPTVDAYPQNKEWLHIFGSTDALLTYSDWALDSLKSQMTEYTNFISSASPSAAECFKPVNKEEHKRKLGMDPSMNIIGTVMRNQRRKLYPALFEAFGKYLKKTKDTKTFLYCHTSYPDNGWDLGTLLHENEISSRVLFSYLCKACNNLEVCKFHDACKQCSNCKNFSSLPVSVSNGVSSETLSEIYNLFDLYVQCASSEGFGLPQVEAAACGVPIATVDYSAMNDIVEKLNADKIEYTVYKELETGCDRAVIDPDALAGYFERFFNQPIEVIKKKGMETRDLFEKHYSWDKSAEVWGKAIDSTSFANWSVPPKIKHIDNEPIPKDITNKEFIEWAMNKYADETKINSYFARSLLRDLNLKRTKGGFGGYFYSDMSVHGRQGDRPIDREIALKMIKEMGKFMNHWEEVRTKND